MIDPFVLLSTPFNEYEKTLSNNNEAPNNKDEMKSKGSTSTFHYVMRIGLLFNEEHAYIRTLSQSI